MKFAALARLQLLWLYTLLEVEEVLRMDRVKSGNKRCRDSDFIALLVLSIDKLWLNHVSRAIEKVNRSIWLGALNAYKFLIVALLNNHSTGRHAKIRDRVLCTDRDFVEKIVRVSRNVLNAVLLVIRKECSWQRVLVVASDYLKQANNCGLESCCLSWQQVAKRYSHSLVLGAALGYHSGRTSSDSILILLLRVILLLDLCPNSATIDACFELRQE